MEAPVSLAAYAPGIFLLGGAQGAIVSAATGEVAAPVDSVPGRPARPAHRGESVSIYCTGLGEVTHRPRTGEPAWGDLLSFTTTLPTVTIGGVPGEVSFSGLAPGFVGLYQVNVEVPASTTTGDAVPLVLTIGGVTANPVTVAVGQ